MQQQSNEIDSVCFPRVYILVLLPAVDMERENQNHGGLYVDYIRGARSAPHRTAAAEAMVTIHRTELKIQVYTRTYIYIYIGPTLFQSKAVESKQWPINKGYPAVRIVSSLSRYICAPSPLSLYYLLYFIP